MKRTVSFGVNGVDITACMHNKLHGVNTKKLAYKADVNVFSLISVLYQAAKCRSVFPSRVQGFKTMESLHKVKNACGFLTFWTLHFGVYH